MRLSNTCGRILAFASLLALFVITIIIFPQPASVVTAQDERLFPAGSLSELSIDTGVGRCVAGPPPEFRGRPGLFGWVNKLTPSTYPATLRAVTIAFNRTGPLGREVQPDQMFRIIVYLDPEMDGPENGQPPDATFIGRVRGVEQFMTFNLISPLRIESGSFVVGVIDEFGVADLPAVFDPAGRSQPPGSESFITLNGGEIWRTLPTALPSGSECSTGSWLIRATVETDPVATLATATIADPAAVEPWAVAINPAGTEAVVTNYASDNLTVINTATNAFTNVPVGDGPGNTPNGPFGVAYRSDGGRIYVTLFGSNTVPASAGSIDFATLEPGRVAVLTRQANGAFTPTVQIAVGTGPMFPALSRDGAKLYVPCAGSDRVDVINTTTNEKIRDIPTGVNSRPSSCTLSLDGSKLYVTNSGSGQVSVINTATDQKIKDVFIPFPGPQDSISSAQLAPAQVAPAQVAIANPWMAEVSPANSFLYVTIWSTESPDRRGPIAVIDTCDDEFVRMIVDDTTRGFAGAEQEAGGGPFGITSCPSGPAMVFTNDGPGVVGVLDSRIDQVVSAPHITDCRRPRGVDCAGVPQPTPPVPGFPPGLVHTAYVACGQPQNSVLVVRVPTFRANISNIPAIESFSAGGKPKVRGLGFIPPVRLEVSIPGTSTCLTFDRPPKFKKGNTQLLQKGRLTDGRKLSDVLEANPLAVVRLVNGEGTVLVLRGGGVTAAALRDH